MLVRGWIFTFFLITCHAQNLSVGFAGGGPLTNAFETTNAGVPETITSHSQRKDYVVGLMLEHHLPGHLSIEGDALYRELHLTVAFVEPNQVLNSVSPSPVVTWELPLMVKYRFHWSKIDPFVEAGPAFRPTTNLNANPSHYGVTAGIGVAARWKQFSLEVDAIYHPIEVSRRSLLGNGEVFNSFSGAEGRTFEFPVLGKYKFRAGRVRPFVAAGPSFRLLTENSSLFGISAGAGLEVRLKALKIEPALRFTHWGPQGYHSPSAGVVVNQFEFLTAVLL